MSALPDIKLQWERSWALSAILGLIDDAELGRITRKMTIPDLDRFAAVIEGYRVDVKSRDAAAPPTPEIKKSSHYMTDEIGADEGGG